MDPERFARIRELFEAARELAPELRGVFIEAECHGDDELRDEVETLLAEANKETEWLGDIVSRVLPAATPASFKIGTTLGTYKVMGMLGIGGMGEVYRARDSRLKRDVAIKVLPGEFSRDADRLARFQREAELLASLNHSHIGAIYDIGTIGDLRFLVLELVEGDTLADIIARGPVPLNEALRLANQIAEALETAHEKRIVHRDLKPANIKIANDGQVKVLDFGLATVHEPEANTDPQCSPTSVSAPEMIIGTAAYMSPEQARGQAAHRASDVWAFGCILYEMLTGRVAFMGDTVGDTIAEVLKAEVDWTLLPADTPEAVRRLLRRCLQKDKKQRLRDIGDARLEIEEAVNRRDIQESARPGAAGEMSRREWLAWASVSGLVAADLGVAWWWTRRSAPLKTSNNIVSAANSNDIVIGSFLSSTGEYATFGKSTKNGIEMARDRANAKNRVLDKTIRIIFEDDQGKPEEAAAKVQKLIAEDGAIALLGEFLSGPSLAAARIAQEKQRPMISHGSTAGDLTLNRDYVFRVCFTDSFQGMVMAKFAFELNCRKVAILQDTTASDYSRGLAEIFKRNFEGIIGQELEYRRGNQDFRAKISLIMQSHSDAIFIPGYYTEVSRIALEAKRTGFKGHLLGGDGWDSPELVKLGGEALEGSYYSNHYSNVDPHPSIPDFVKDYTEIYHEPPDAAAALAYDAANVLFDAIGRAESTDPAKIRDSIASTRNFMGVTGNITLNENQDAFKQAVVVQIQNRKPAWVKTIPPYL